MKDRGDLERERDSLRMEANMLKNKLTLQESNIQDLKSSIEEKVRDLYTHLICIDFLFYFSHFQSFSLNHVCNGSK